MWALLVLSAAGQPRPSPLQAAPCLTPPSGSSLVHFCLHPVSPSSGPDPAPTPCPFSFSWPWQPPLPAEACLPDPTCAPALYLLPSFTSTNSATCCMSGAGVIRVHLGLLALAVLGALSAGNEHEATEQAPQGRGSCEPHPVLPLPHSWSPH